MGAVPDDLELWRKDEWLTLQLGPLWVVSALTGRSSFDADEQNAFWDCVTEIALVSQGLPRTLLSSMAAERRWLFDQFQLSSRPIVSGLLEVTDLLERTDPDSSERVRTAILEIGRAFARARGPFGRRMTLQDERTLLLMEQLLQTSAENIADNPLNSHLPI
jgi:hypothetical protein